MEKILCTYTLSRWEPGKGTVNTEHTGMLLEFVVIPPPANVSDAPTYADVQCIVWSKETGELYQVDLRAVRVI